ncbi:MAG: hypothetical protein HZB25_03005 [Candidatus Eisenbacteria bacterium]|nr:hypothetical protein [Candidatus Eisenbacteria bacterium]
MTFTPKLRASLAVGLAVACILLVPVRAARAADFSVRLDLNGVAQFLFDTEPRLVMVPNTSAYYAQDVPSADVYRVNNNWYTFYRDNWYRSESYRGTWARCNVDAVPQELMQVPNGYYHFARPNRGDYQNDRYGDSGGRHSRNSDGSFSRDPAGGYNRNQDGSYSRIVTERYARTPDGSYSRDAEGGYFRNSDGSYSRDSDYGYDDRDNQPPYRGPYRGYNRRGSDREPDGSWIRFAVEPRMYAIPRSRMSYARDHRPGELYRDGANWYYSFGGNWYGSRSYAGPWRYVAAERVPVRITNTPRGYYRSLRGRGMPAQNSDYDRRNARTWQP